MEVNKMKEMNKNEHSFKEDNWMSNEHSWKEDNWMSEETLDQVSGGADKINGGKGKTKDDENVKIANHFVIMDKNDNKVETVI